MIKISFTTLFLLLLLAKANAQHELVTNAATKRDSTPITSSIPLEGNNYVEKREAFTGNPTLNMYGDLLNDDPLYNLKYPWWKPASRVLATNVLLLGIDRYIFNFDFAHVGFTTWGNNFKNGFEWDNDPFGVNFVGHPYTGNFYVNVARSNGYNYWQSFPFALGGSLVWEFLGENTRPSYNDIINTPVSGAFIGEIFYRLSSNMLDDRRRGGNRVFREIVAGLLNPARAFNRLIQGKTSRITTTEVYQKEPLNVTLFAGIHKVNVDRKFGTGTTNALLNLQFDYGNPFEDRHRKPFDFFKVRTELTFNSNRKLVENVTGYGVLISKNVKVKNNDVMLGLFQHFDYWDNNLFELGSIGFGAGIISRLALRKHSNLYSSFHFAAVPLAGNSTHTSVDIDAKLRQYNYGGGLEAKIDETLNLNNWASIGFSAYYYWLSTYHGTPGFSQVAILKPRLTVRIMGNTSIGVEQHFYNNTRSLNDIPTFNVTTTEQKFFVLIYLEDKKRTGKFQ
jgi:hypothetical protein